MLKVYLFIVNHGLKFIAPCFELRYILLLGAQLRLFLASDVAVCSKETLNNESYTNISHTQML